MSDAGARRSVVEFWRLVELFTPQTVNTVDPRNRTRPVVDWAPGGSLPWIDRRPAVDQRPKFGWIHTVYLGVYDLEDAYEEMLAAFPEDPDAYEERPPGQSACAAVVVDDTGRVLTDLAVLSSAMWGVGRLRRRGLADPSWAFGLEQDQQTFRETLDELQAGRDRTADPALSGADETLLVELVRVALSATDTARLPRVASTAVRIASSWQRVDLDPEPPFLNSFFLDDLAAVAHGEWGEALTRYLTPDRDVGLRERVDVRVDTGTVNLATGVDRMPFGRWPADPGHPLATSQQFAVNTVMNELSQRDGILGVNGPPGTGKTTMLRDIVAGNVTMRAERLAELDHPREAFVPGKDLEFKVGGDSPWRVPRLKDRFTGFEMVVASSNNSAVANVSSELPRRTSIHSTWTEVDYFAGIAGLTSRDSTSDAPVDAWALVAARLGKSKYRNEFDSALWDGAPADDDADGPEEIQGLRHILKQWSGQPDTRPDWDATRRRFKDLRSKVVGLVAERTLAQRRLHDRTALLQRMTSAAEALHRCERELIAAQQTQRERGEHLLALRQNAQLWLDRRQRHLDLRPSWWSTAVTFGGSGRRWREELRAISDGLDPAEHSAVIAAQQLDASTADLGRLTSMHEAARRQAALLEATQVELDRALASDAEKYGPCHPGHRWLTDDTHRELHGAWLDPDLNKARADLFVAALDLHKAFVANVPGIHGRLIAATKIVRGGVPKDLDPEIRLAGWQLFFLMVPLVSTTFASAGRMLGGLKASSLGWLLIDEAGQATPQSAVGAIWRARRVVAVGDPLQLTPVVTVPRRTQEALAAHHGVSGTWIPGSTSVQGQADRVGRWGTPLPLASGSTVWVSAPLRVHRRCDEPMFSISNSIAYDNLMINGVARRSPDGAGSLPASSWLDIPAATSGQHVQPAELHKLRDILASLTGSYGIDPTDIIAISPFRKVADAIKPVLDRYPGMIGGTIHTAQGREADVVILVLGGDPAKPGAKRWAAGSPNLVNVAVSRAKRRLYVIGDRSAWTPHPYFSELKLLAVSTQSPR